MATDDEQIRAILESANKAGIDVEKIEKEYITAAKAGASAMATNPTLYYPRRPTNYIGKPVKIGRHDHVPYSEFNADELRSGIKEEQEHTDDIDVAVSIAKDHLSEDSEYYSKLKRAISKNPSEENMDAYVSFYHKLREWIIHQLKLGRSPESIVTEINAELGDGWITIKDIEHARLTKNPRTRISPAFHTYRCNECKEIFEAYGSEVECPNCGSEDVQ